ncbi:hypothetical protein FACS189487_08160 [Campylobacterota bacterium]|nr:hypothetical protein FACS189487_08160 [Campylobacterota bacterium]
MIVIIGTIYAIATVSIGSKSSEQSAAKWRLDRLDTALRELSSGYVLLYCDGEKCENCTAVNAKNEVIAQNLPLFDQPPKVRYYDDTGYLAERLFFNDRCFEMERYENGSISELLVEHGGKFYRYYALIRRAEVFDDAVQASESIDARSHIPETAADFYNETE